MTARPFEQQSPRRLQARYGVSSRAVSIALAVLADAGLALLLFEQHWVSSPPDIEPFWVQQFIAFALYSTLQLWTLAHQTGRGDEFAATIDKMLAASPALVTVLIQMRIGHDSGAALSWRQHVVSAIWSVFSIADFFATDITNQRLRMRQLNSSPPAE